LIWWIAVMAWLGIGTLRRGVRLRGHTPTQLLRAVGTCVPAATVLAHAGYYTIVVGGDHFEYRVYSPLVPLVFVTMVWALDRLRWPAARACAVLAAFVLCSGIIGWTHWLATRHLQTRRETGNLVHRVAPHLPAALGWYARPFDDLQAQLIARMICVRHQEHKIFYEHKVATLPARALGEQIGPEGLPVLAAGEAGYVAWVLPHVAIIDTFGLNDYYVARNRELMTRRMAHSREPPPGYVDAFAPNVRVRRGTWQARTRKTPLTPDDVIQIERSYDVWLANLR